MNPKLRVGLLGLGNIGSVHLRSLSVMDHVRVTAVADTDPERRAEAKRRADCATYADYEELLETEDIDVSIVSLPPFLHADATVQSAEQGAHAFVEKPFALSTDEARTMREAARDHGVKLGVDHTLRYQPDFREMKRQFETGRLGDVPLASISRFNNGPFSSPPDRTPVADWQLDPELAGGGVVFRLGVHLLDILEWFFGDLSVEYARLDGQLHSPVEDTAVVVLDAPETNATAVLTCGSFQWESLPDVNMTFRLEGTTDSLENGAFLPDSLELHAAKSMVENVANRGLGRETNVFGPTYYYQAHYRSIEDFVESVLRDEQPSVGGREGLRTIELAERVYETAEGEYGI